MNQIKKNALFLKTVSRETNMDVTIINDRIEDINLDIAPDVITARALAPLDKLFQYCQNWIEMNTNLCLIFPKGQNYKSELDKCSKNWYFDKETHSSKIDNNSVIIVFKNISKK